AARVRRAARVALARPARRHPPRGPFIDAAGAQGQAAGMGGGMSTSLRVGLMVPVNNTTMEVELAAWLPAGSTVTTVKIPRGEGLLARETLAAYCAAAIALAGAHWAGAPFDLRA